MARRALTKPKAALAGVMLEISFARFRASMAKFNVERALFPPFCRRDAEAIVEPRGRGRELGDKQAAKDDPNPSMDGRLLCLRYASTASIW